MKYILYGILIVIVILIGCYLLLMMSAKKIDEYAYEESLKIIVMLESFHLAHGKYPDNLSEEFNRYNLRQRIVYGILATKITVDVYDGYFELFYYQPPLGPFHEYNSQQKEWSFSE
ncbi:MAG: hypothetical protein RBT80_10840 [Candidatus Vecturithrix sp.]|jgi:hypothetical protein|nr:hypothetical protein [Candidatus Vecturithrix sp.]